MRKDICESNRLGVWEHVCNQSPPEAERGESHSKQSGWCSEREPVAKEKQAEDTYKAYEHIQGMCTHTRSLHT